jgi:hypothetical protein
MPMKGANKKEQRQYTHIKASAKKKGRSTKRAKQIAAATVNKQKSTKRKTKTTRKKKSS